MYATVTKVQMQDILSQVYAPYLMYDKTVMNVDHIALGNSTGWTTYLLSDVYSEADLLTDFPGGILVTAIVL